MYWPNYAKNASFCRLRVRFLSCLLRSSLSWWTYIINPCVIEAVSLNSLNKWTDGVAFSIFYSFLFGLITWQPQARKCNILGVTGIFSYYMRTLKTLSLLHPVLLNRHFKTKAWLLNSFFMTGNLFFLLTHLKQYHLGKIIVLRNRIGKNIGWALNSAPVNISNSLLMFYPIFLYYCSMLNDFKCSNTRKFHLKKFTLDEAEHFDKKSIEWVKIHLPLVELVASIN